MSHQPAKHSSFYGAFVGCVVLMLYVMYVPLWIAINGEPTSPADTFMAAAVNTVGLGLLTTFIVEVFRWLRGRV